MNILFLSSADKLDYQCDCILHGLNTLPEVQVFTVSDVWYMYQGNQPEDLLKQYGMGFTLTNRIPLEKKRIQTPEEALEKIRVRFYDKIIYGSIYRCDLFLDEVLKHYTRDEILFVDGEDHDMSFFFYRWHRRYFTNQRQFLEKKKKAHALSGQGIFFKRELRETDRNRFFPISFAIPSENIVHSVPEKTREMAIMMPGVKETYIYTNEQDYNLGYQEAKFGTTFKKSGWDCMRHYEILANGCIPYFPDIKELPLNTMVHFPRELILETNRLYESGRFTEALYAYYSQMLLDYTRQYLTTTSLAKYILAF